MEVRVVLYLLVETLERIVKINALKLSCDQRVQRDLHSHVVLVCEILHLIFIDATWTVGGTETYIGV